MEKRAFSGQATPAPARTATSCASTAPIRAVPQKS